MNLIKTFVTSYADQTLDWKGQFHFIQAISLGFRLSNQTWLEEHELDSELRDLLKVEPLDECLPKEHSELILISRDSAGLIPSSDQRRQKHLGKTSKRYLQKEFPALPSHCKPAYFQRAPDSQQLTKRFEPNEVIRMGSHQINTQLPNVVPRLFQLIAGEFKEVDALADTLILAPEKNVGVVTWRAVSKVNSFDAKEIQSCLVALDHPNQQRNLSHFYQVYSNRTGTQASHYALKTDDLLPVSISNTANSAPTVLAEVAKQAHRQQETFKPVAQTRDNTKKRDFRRCVYQNHHFVDCDFSGAEFHETQFHQCVFDHCRFEKTQIQNTDFYFSTFDHCHWQWMTIKNSHFRQTHWKQMIVDRCLFLENDLSGALLERCHFHDAHFDQSQWQYSILKQLNWQNSRHSNAVFDRATARQCNFYGSQFLQCLIEASDFSECQFTKAEFGNSQIRDSNLLNADFSKASFSDSRMNQNKARDIGMGNSVWNNCELQQNDFTESILIGASLTNCAIESNNFERSELSYLSDKQNHWNDNNFSHTILSAQKKEPQNAAIE